MGCLRPRLVLSALLLISAFGAVSAQSTDVKNPAPMAAGPNKAVIDSFGGDQFWSFMVQPGSFSVRFSAANPQEGFAIGGKAVMAAAFAPKTAGSVIAAKDTPSGTVWSGHVTQPTRVVVMVEPKKSALVRQTTEYLLEATGSASFAAGAATRVPSVVGMYNAPGSTTTMAKLSGDGSITTTDGGHGHWELFDADSRTYVIVLNGVRTSVTFQPGRGFISTNGNLFMELKHQ